MLGQLLQIPELISYILAAEGLILCVLRCRTNYLIRKGLKMISGKKEKRERLKHEIKNGDSDIPIVKFEKEAPVAKEERKSGFNAKEMAVLQDLLTEYFG